ncbi:MAG: dihydroorotate dehydrogenase [Anaerolineae bacterium]|nr:dihydroorotate dehydrogenase [Gemmatimonadaceae bacterium]
MSSRQQSKLNGAAVLTVRIGGLTFQNPIVLAAGTAGYGRELAGVMDLDALGGIVTKAVSPLPRSGAPAPRVAEFANGMINAVGLANPGLQEVNEEHLPWLSRNLRRAITIVNVVGYTADDYVEVVTVLSDSPGVGGFELNVSCPNVERGGLEFGSDLQVLGDLVRRTREATRKQLFVKLSPVAPDIVSSARTAVDAGADCLTLVNTVPGLVIDVGERRPVLGFGTGGISGSAILPIGVLATWKVRNAVTVPLMGVGGVSSAMDALQYLIAGASLVGVGTGALRDPGLPARIVADLERWCSENCKGGLGEIIGSLQMPK